MHRCKKNTQNNLHTQLCTHLSRSGHGQPVQLEAVGSVPMSGLRLQVLREVDDRDRPEGTLCDKANTQDTRTPIATTIALRAQ